MSWHTGDKQQWPFDVEHFNTFPAAFTSPENPAIEMPLTVKGTRNCLLTPCVCNDEPKFAAWYRGTQVKRRSFIFPFGPTQVHGQWLHRDGTVSWPTALFQLADLHLWNAARGIGSSFGFAWPVTIRVERIWRQESAPAWWCIDFWNSVTSKRLDVEDQWLEDATAFYCSSTVHLLILSLMNQNCNVSQGKQLDEHKEELWRFLDLCDLDREIRICSGCRGTGGRFVLSARTSKPIEHSDLEHRNW